MEKINFALLGCSRISSQHIKAIRELDDRCTLTDICDINNEALERIRLETNAKPFNKFEDMLQSTSADCIIITTPNGLHAQHAISAFGSGFNVVTEKPMATSVRDAENMIDACAKYKRKLFVVKQVRFSKSIQMIKEAIDKKRFGKVYMVNLNLFWTRPQEFYDAADWRGSIMMDGGTLLNQGSHYIDVINWLFGPISEVSAMNATLGRDIESEDSSIMNLKLKENTLGSIAITVLTYPKNLECSLTILGEKGTVKLGGPSLNIFHKWQFSEMTESDIKVEAMKPFEAGFSHIPYYEDILNVLQNGSEPQTDGYEGIKSIKIIEAAIKSSETDRVIKL